jgi:hypothetical protein
VRSPRFFEFRDEDGSYAVVRPLDESRGRVVTSDVWEAGVILYKNPKLTWEEAGKDVGVEAGFQTRLGPSDFAPDGPKAGDLDREDFHGHEEDRVLFDLLEADLEPESESRQGGPAERLLYPDRWEAPPDLLMHLVVHYLKITEPDHDDGRWDRLCGCPQRPLHQGTADVLYAVVTSALAERGLPNLDSIVSALRALRAEEVAVA